MFPGLEARGPLRIVRSNHSAKHGIYGACGQFP